MVAVAREVYHRHPHELSEERRRYCRTFIAMDRLKEELSEE